MEQIKIDKDTVIDYNEDYAMLIQGNDRIFIDKETIEIIKGALMNIQFEWEEALSEKLKLLRKK